MNSHQVRTVTQVKRVFEFRRLPLLLAALVVSGILGCAQYDSDIGGSIVGDQMEGEVRDTVIMVSESQTWIMGDVDKLSGAYLPIGKQDGMESDDYLQFTHISYYADSILTIDSAFISLFEQGFVDSERVVDWTEWDVMLQRVDEQVNVDSLRWDDRPAVTDLGLAHIGLTTDQDSLIIPLDTNLVRFWMGDSTNYGLFMTAQPGAGFLKRFYSGFVSDDSLRPKLWLRCSGYFDDELVADTLLKLDVSTTSYVVNDIELVEGTGRVYLSDGYVRKALMRSSFNSFSPTEESVLRAELFIHLDLDWPRMIGDPGIFTVYKVTTSWDDPDTLGVEAVLSSGVNVPGDTNMVRLDVTSLVRSWYTDPNANVGLSIQPTLGGTTLGRIAIFDQSVEADSLKPYFRVIYSEYAR